MEIAHITKPHPETGLVNSKLGVWLFLASEVMLFGALFSSYIIMRIGSTTWPHGYTILNVPLATVNTFALISSSVTIVLAWASLKLNDFGKFRMYMTGTIALSFVFLVIKYFEYTAKFEHGLYPSTNTFLAIYFTMTGLHGLHVIGGIIVNAVPTWRIDHMPYGGVKDSGVGREGPRYTIEEMTEPKLLVINRQIG